MRFKNKKNRVVLSYNWKLRSLVDYIQQLEMESLGNGESLDNLECSGKLNLTDTDRVDSLRSSSGVGGDARARRLGKLEASNTAIFMCDIQERFASSIAHFLYDSMYNYGIILLKAILNDEIVICYQGNH